jgi:hypothetical protein
MNQQFRPSKKTAATPVRESQGGARRVSGFSPWQVFVLFLVCTLLISIPIWTHPLPPISDYINHLARMHVIATIHKNPLLANFYEIDWKIIPNLTMDLIVPVLARWVNIYLAGQIFMVVMFAVIISGTLTLNRVLIGRWSLFPLVAFPLLYNYVFLVGLMNYLFGIGLALWALAAWVALREQMWPLRLFVSTCFVVSLFFCHLSSLGIYGVGILSFELLRLWQQRAQPWPMRMVDFVVSGLPFLAAAPLLYKSPTLELASAIYWEQQGKIDGLFYVVSNYSDVVAIAMLAVALVASVWAVRHRVLRFHPFVYALLAVGIVVYLALPRIMFETYMADQRVPIGIAFMLAACGDLELRRRLVRRGFIAVLVVLIGVRMIEIDLNWSGLSDTTSEFRASVRKLQRGSTVFVAYADRSSGGDDVRDLGLVHAACIAMIERSSLVTTAFTVVGKQVLHVRPNYRQYVDSKDGTPPSMSQLLVAAQYDNPIADMPEYWRNWPKFDYLYVLFTEDEAPNPDPSRLRLVVEGDRFQLYRIVKPQDARLNP